MIRHKELFDSAGSVFSFLSTLFYIRASVLAWPMALIASSINMYLYLRISPELNLKRLNVGGVEKVFEIGRIFRNEGIDEEHLQDYTQMEFYWAYADNEMLIEFVEKMLKTVIQETLGTLKTTWRGH